MTKMLAPGATVIVPSRHQGLSLAGVGFLFFRPAYWKVGYPWVDVGQPCFWPLYEWRVRTARKYPQLHRLIWNDWR